ncbi:hypothetical protein B296_00038746 [Ensete ventricosum]|uniref:Uncharacterized protein n=1 Tax=Ensete ventricosum TaxID=4639 RepID=A0A426ZL47_ENSVE|nr:hypothetical protein B296_00038746 [Ensete ventricosum]
MGHQKERENGHHLLGNLLPQLAGLLPQHVHFCTQSPNPKLITGTLRKLPLLPATPHQKSPDESTIWQRHGAQITRICQRKRKRKRKRNRNEGGCGAGGLKRRIDRHGRRTHQDNGDKTYVLDSVKLFTPTAYLSDEWIHLWTPHKTQPRCVIVSQETGIKTVLDNDR